MMENDKMKKRFGLPVRGTIAALLTATALSGCAQLQAELEEMFTPRIELLTEIEQDLYRAILASDKVEKLRKTPSKATARKAQKTAAASVAKKPAKPTVDASVETASAAAKTAEKSSGEAVASTTSGGKPTKVTLTETEETPQSGSVYLSKSEINPVQLTFQGDAQTFFTRVADDIDYKLVEEGNNRMVDLNIKANGEPLFGVAIRAANYVEKDMRVRFDMEEKLIRIEYLDQ